MGILINNINYSYDYDELLCDLENELETSDLHKTSYIQILRSEEPVFGDYKPIIDYYYEDEIMQDILTIDADDDIDEIEYIIKQKDLYLKDKPTLELMLVSDVIDEMRKILNPIDFI